MGDSYLDTSIYELVSESDNEQVFERKIALQMSENKGTDTFAYQQGFITITPLKFDWTSMRDSRKDSKLDLTLAQ